MDMPRINRAADLLVGARRTGQLLESLPADATPANIAEGHAIQDAVTAGLGKPVGAYKAMAPAHGEPTRGVIYADTIHASPARIPAADVPQCGVEGEVAFVFRRDLPPRPAPYTRDEASHAVDACRGDRAGDQPLPQIPHGLEPAEAGANISNAAFVRRAAPARWRGLELAS